MGISSRKWFFLFQLILFLFNAHLSTAADSISVGQSLSGNKTIISEGGNYELGFFTPGNSTRYYIGIWLKKVSKQTVVWVANRDKPLPHNSSELKISEDGNLALFSSSNFQIWSTNSVSSTSNSTVAVLLDSGNLVLRDGLNETAVIWQSFDHPTDTWLPEMKLGINKITGEVWALTSWRNLEDPSPGIFSLQIDPNGSNEFVLYWKRSQIYWSSGVWNGQFFSSVPEMSGNMFGYRFVSNDKEKYFYFFITGTVPITRFAVDFTGQWSAFYWIEDSQNWVLASALPRARCENYSLCGAFGSCHEDTSVCRCLQGFEPRFSEDWYLSDWSGGCVRKTQLQCEKNSSDNGETDGFLMMPNMTYPENPQSLAVGNAKECELACLNNCSCTAYAYNGGGCTIWNGDLFNLQELSDGDLYLRLAASELPQSSGEERKVVVIVIVAASGVVLILGVWLLLIWSCRRKGKVKKLKGLPGSLVNFSYRELQTATKNFSEKLGGGSFGYVFKGALPDLTDIAVKKLGSYTQGEKQFRAEVSTIGMIQHLNLVRLRGFCAEGAKRLLVYDYMREGSLDSHLFGKNSMVLDWKTRYQIALGIARGLSYLHEETRECIIHCDIKPENILLDDAFCPKLADFGLAKLVGREFSRVLTTMRGTRGYLAPEWLSGLAITPKADVYSYGMMLFEIISGKRNTSKESEDAMISFFPISAAQKLNQGNFSSLLDCRLQGDADMEEVSRACRVAGWCIQDNEMCRPSMGLVVQFLEGTLEVQIPPIPRFLQILVGNPESTIYLSAFSPNQAQGNVSTRSQDEISASTSSTHEILVGSPESTIYLSAFSPNQAQSNVSTRSQDEISASTSSTHD